MGCLRFSAGVRGFVLVVCISVVATAGLALLEERPNGGSERRIVSNAPVAVDDLTVPPHREPAPPPPPPPPPPPKPRPKAAPKTVRVVNVDIYRGLGAWVDVYDDGLDPVSTVDEMARRGVKTIYLETNNWHSRGGGSCQTGPDVDILYPDAVSSYLSRAHVKGMNVVAWYVPGFADIDRDVRRSLGAINFVSPSGNRFDGFAADVETRGEFICKGVSGDDVRTRFNAGITEYSGRLRGAVPSERLLGAIVVDAKNNERAPARWEGYPWAEIAKRYDALMPMAYWTVSPANGGCPGSEIDTAGYVREVVSKTNALMGGNKPMHVIGGVADCITAVETAGYVAGAVTTGSLGGSLYDFAATQSNSAREAIWAELSRFSR